MAQIYDDQNKPVGTFTGGETPPPVGIARGSTVPRAMQGSGVPQQPREYLRPNQYANPFMASMKESGDYATDVNRSPQAALDRNYRQKSIRNTRDLAYMQSELAGMRTPAHERERNMRLAGRGERNPFMSAMQQTALNNQYGREDRTYANGLQSAFNSVADNRQKVAGLNNNELMNEMNTKANVANAAMTAGGYARRDDLEYDIKDRESNRRDVEADEKRRNLFMLTAERYGPEYAAAMWGNPFFGNQAGGQYGAAPQGAPSYGYGSQGAAPQGAAPQGAVPYGYGTQGQGYGSIGPDGPRVGPYGQPFGETQPAPQSGGVPGMPPIGGSYAAEQAAAAQTKFNQRKAAGVPDHTNAGREVSRDPNSPGYAERLKLMDQLTPRLSTPGGAMVTDQIDDMSLLKNYPWRQPDAPLGQRISGAARDWFHDKGMLPAAARGITSLVTGDESIGLNKRDIGADERWAMMQTPNGQTRTRVDLEGLTPQEILNVYRFLGMADPSKVQGGYYHEPSEPTYDARLPRERSGMRPEDIRRLQTAGGF